MPRGSDIRTPDGCRSDRRGWEGSARDPRRCLRNQLKYRVAWSLSSTLLARGKTRLDPPLQSSQIVTIPHGIQQRYSALSSSKARRGKCVKSIHRSAETIGNVAIFEPKMFPNRRHLVLRYFYPTTKRDFFRQMHARGGEILQRF